MNLQRLADSPLLLDGFEEFIRKWLGDPPPAKVPKPDSFLELWLMTLPPEVILENKGKDRLQNHLRLTLVRLDK